jgi:hypothetical protein
MFKRIKANSYDPVFKQEDGACYVKGYWSDSWMGQFSGVGYSSAPFKMKAIMRDGIVYIPDPNRPKVKADIDFKAPWEEVEKQFAERGYIEWVEARVQPPSRAIEMIGE